MSCYIGCLFIEKNEGTVIFGDTKKLPLPENADKANQMLPQQARSIRKDGVRIDAQGNRNGGKPKRNAATKQVAGAWSN